MRKSIGLFFLFLLFATAAFAQLTQLSGTVTDPGGAVIPGATVTLINTQTGAERETKSDDQGRYNFPQELPGLYKVVAKANGFADETLDKIELFVSQPASINIVFQKIGSTSTTVTVEAAATQINTTDATLGNVIVSSQIMELPSFARNVAALLQFQPGVTPGGNVNGGKSDQGNITLDGADVNNQNTRQAMTSVLNVTMDSVAEFRTTTTNGNSDEGRTSGGQISLVTKSGTNSLHGSAYEYRRGTETAANDFFSNSAGVPIAPLLINIFGGTIGGAVKKNKIFYFINYEGRRDASAAIQTRTVPTDTFRAGILQYRSTSGQIISLSPAQVQSNIDTAHIGEDGNILSLLQGMPHGNFLGTGADNLNLTGYIFNSPEHNIQNTYISRWDWNIDDAGKHRLFVRGQLQDFWQSGAEQFPGQSPASVGLNNSKGTAVGYTWLAKPNLIATTNWGFTRAGSENTGVLTANYVIFRGMSSPYPTTTDSARIIPVNTINEDIAWTKGAHDIRIGGVIRVISNSSVSFGGSFSDGYINAPWLAGTGKDFSPSDLSSSFRTPFVNAGAIIMGLVTEGDAHYNYLVNGSVLPQGAPVSRDFKNQEYEWYAQDTWRISRSLTFTYGIRHSIMPPVYEANGQQTSTIPALSNWMADRLGLANVGAPQSLAPPINYVLSSGPNGSPLYPDHLKNFAPRIAIAYSPQGDSGISKFLFGGPGKTSIRAGWGMFYDLFGQPLAQQYASDALGFSTLLMNPANSFTTATAPRFTAPFSLPTGLLPAAPPGGFPQVAPNAFAISNSIDPSLNAPYTLNTNVSIGREFNHGFFVQGSFVQRLSRRSLVQRDLAEPTNLLDTKSGQTFYQAMNILGPLVLANQGNGAGVANIPKIPFFEDLFPGLANPAKNLTASQGAYNVFVNNQGDMTSGLTTIDTPPSLGGCNPSCSIYGPYALFNAQYSALEAFSSVGHGNYNSMQWTVRKRLSNGLQFDFNYTLARSVDLGSATEGAGTYTGFMLNIWEPNQMWAPSSYDARHTINMFAIWQVPVGKGRTYMTNANRLVDGILGGWQITPTWQWESALPTSVGDGQNWATDWNLTTTATQIGPFTTAPTQNVAATSLNGTVLNSSGGPNLFANPAAAFQAFAFTVEGNSGSRDNVRYPGPWVINLGIAKTFFLFNYKDVPHQLQIRGEAFNLTNSVVFTAPGMDLGTATSFGKFSNDTGARQMQFAMRYSF